MTAFEKFEWIWDCDIVTKLPAQMSRILVVKGFKLTVFISTCWRKTFGEENREKKVLCMMLDQRFVHGTQILKIG